MSMFDMYRAKKKREVDPNAPPRPNLMSHDKVIRDQKAVIEQMEQTVRVLTARVETLERKNINQTAYLNAVHQQMQHMVRKK
jgi:predicted RNase H-like nuclease (RuvC/YqgF family)